MRGHHDGVMLTTGSISRKDLANEYRVHCEILRYTQDDTNAGKLFTLHS